MIDCHLWPIARQVSTVWRGSLGWTVSKVSQVLGSTGVPSTT